MLWKDIPGYEGLYKISEYGDVYSYFIDRVMKPDISNKGYKVIDLSKDKERRKFLIHRLVAITFIPNPEGYPIVLHLDNNKLNTHYTNLKWGTYSENNAQAIRDGINTIPRPDTRKVFEVYNDSIYWRCLGIKYIIESNNWGTDSGFRDYIYRKTPINQGTLKGCYLNLAPKQKPFTIGI